jgi:hypothetical protein
MQPSGVLSPFPNASNPPLRCRHNNLTDRLRRSDGCCQNYASWSDTSAALLRSETERFSTLLIKNSGCNLRLRTRKTKPIFLHLFNGLRNGRTRGPESARQSPPVLAAHTLWHRPALGDSSATASLMFSKGSGRGTVYRVPARCVGVLILLLEPQTHSV